MNEDIKFKWVAALRGGEYRKSVNVLKRYFKTVTPRHCCMGVLCEVIKDDYPGVADLLEKNADDAFHNAMSSRFALLDYKALAFTGINSDQQRTLTSMNDKGASFERIAKYIEKYV